MLQLFVKMCYVTYTTVFLVSLITMILTTSEASMMSVDLLIVMSQVRTMNSLHVNFLEISVYSMGVMTKVWKQNLHEI